MDQFPKMIRSATHSFYKGGISRFSVLACFNIPYRNKENMFKNPLSTVLCRDAKGYCSVSYGETSGTTIDAFSILSTIVGVAILAESTTG